MRSMKCALGDAVRTLFATAGVAVLVSCDGLAPETLDVARVEVAPPVLELPRGGTATLTARVYGGDGSEVAGRSVFWSVQNPSVATVSSGGVVTAVGPGTTQVSASSAGQSGVIAVTVVERPVALVRMVPPTTNVLVGATVTLTAEPLDALGNVLTGRPITWSSLNPALATVSAQGVVTGLVPGTVTIQASVEDKVGSAVVTVAAVPIASIDLSPANPIVDVGESLQLVGTPRDAGGTPLPGRALMWATSNNAVATVSSTGLLTGIAAGRATVTVSAPGAGPQGSTPSSSTTVDVNLPAIARVEILPPNASVRISGTTTFHVSLFDSDDEQLTAAGRVVTWSSSDPAVATVNSATGVATGVSLGVATITADVATPGQPGSVRGTAGLTVTTIPVASVEVTPNPGTVYRGPSYALQFSATTRDASGNVLVGRSVVWTSSNQTIASVDPGSGVVTGLATGSVQIRAVSEGVQGHADVTVDLVPIASLDVSPASSTLTPPQTVTLTATPRDASGAVVSGVSLGGRTVTWASDDPAIATVNVNGVVTGVGAGTTGISAFMGTGSGRAVVTVLQRVNGVTVVPARDSLVLPGSMSAFARVLDAAGAPVPGRTVALSSSAPGVATVSAASGTTDANGLVSFTITGVAPGTASIRASSDGVTGTANIRVLPRVHAVAVTAPTDSIIDTGTLQATATLTDANSIVLTGRPVVWSSSSTSVATVDAAGLITGVSPGTATITAASEGQTGSLAIRVVTTVMPAQIKLSAASDSIIGQGSIAGSITVTDGRGTPVAAAQVAIDSRDPGIATVSPASATTDTLGAAGFSVTGAGPGSTFIVATIGSISDSIAVRVLAPVSRVRITPGFSIIAVGGSTTLTVEVRDAAGNPLMGRVCAVPGASTGNRATVSPSGNVVTDANGQIALTVTGTKSGTAGVTVTCEGVSDTATVTIL